MILIVIKNIRMNYQLHGQGLTRRASEYPKIPPGQHFMARKDMRTPSIPIAYGLSTDQKAYSNFNAGVHVRPSSSKGKTGGMYRRRRRSSRRRTGGPPRGPPPRRGPPRPTSGYYCRRRSSRRSYR